MMKTQIPLLLCAVAGLFMVAQYFIPAWIPLYNRVTDYIQIVTAFSIVLGVASVIHRHAGRLQKHGREAKRHKDWPYSLAAVVGMIVMIVAGIGWGRDQDSIFQKIFNSILLPVQATMFALLAFYLASAAFRAFRTRSVDATVLLITALIVMIGRLDDLGIIKMPEISQWILRDGPNLWSKRAILLGVGLGMASTALKVVLGIERTYLGSGRD